MIQSRIRHWKTAIIAGLLIFLTAWASLQWAEKTYALEGERWIECGHFEIQQYHAFSLWDKALRLWPAFGGRAEPQFFLIVDKRSGQQIAETDVHWISTSPQATCPNTKHPGRLIVFFGDDRSEKFMVQP